MALFHSQKSFLKSAATGDVEEFTYCLKNLIPSAFSIDVTDGKGRTALYRAAENGELEMIKALLAEKANPDIADDHGYTPLHRAVDNGQTAAARLLIAGGADVNAHNHKYVTPILTAARYGQIDVVKDLVAAHCDINAVSAATGRTGLHWACENGHTPVVEFLIAQGARTDILDRKQVMPIINAAREGQLEIVKALVAGRADVNAVSGGTGRTALHWAVDNNYVPIVEFLVAKNARVDIADHDGNTAFDIARDKDLAGLVKLLETRQAAGIPAPEAATSPAADGEWALLGSTRVAHVMDAPALNRRITEVFNFENRERVLITENLKTGAETMTQPEKFETIAEDVIARAAERLKALGGAAPDKGQKKAFNL